MLVFPTGSVVFLPAAAGLDSHGRQDVGEMAMFQFSVARYLLAGASDLPTAIEVGSCEISGKSPNVEAIIQFITHDGSMVLVY